jgi:pimeloyl-ACP methyl ester carboxylesterase
VTDPASAGGDAGGRLRDERRVDVPDGRVRVRVRGEGPPLLCLHGVSAHGGVWRRVADRLDEAFTLHVPDLLGRGGSGARPDVSYRLEREAARAAALSAGFPDRGYLVAGHSQGAAVAVASAARAGRERTRAAEGRTGRPAGGDGSAGAGAARVADGPKAAERTPRPAGLVLLAPVTPWTRRPLALEALRLSPVRRLVARALQPVGRPLARWVLEHRAFGDPGRVDADTVLRYAGPWSDAASGRTLLRVLADWRPAELSAHLPAVPPPARVVAGALDRRIRPLEARRWAGRLGAGFTVARDAGHMVPVERPALAAEAVRRVAERAGLAG